MPSFVPLKADSPDHPSDAMKMKLILCSLTALLPGDKEWPNKVKGIYDNLIRDLNLKPEHSSTTVGGSHA
jgi:hypothetical protein